MRPDPAQKPNSIVVRREYQGSQISAGAVKSLQRYAANWAAWRRKHHRCTVSAEHRQSSPGLIHLVTAGGS
jgi:head-tail adaptor